MKTKLLYLDDCYLKEFEATVLEVNNGKFIILDQSALYLNGGGQPFDTGRLVRLSDNKEFKVIFSGKFNDEASYEVDKEGLKEGDKVRGIVDWDRRYKLMRTHTATHVLAGFLHKEAGAMITGNQLDIDKTRMDFSMENYDKEKMIEFIDKANALMKQGREVKIYYVDKNKDLDKFMRLAKGLPENLIKVRIVDIVDFDAQPDGGTHVKNTSECGEIEFLKSENKGKNNRRMYFKLK